MTDRPAGSRRASVPGRVPRRAWLPVLPAALGLLLMAACGGGGDDGAEGETAADTAAEAAAPEAAADEGGSAAPPGTTRAQPASGAPGGAASGGSGAEPAPTAEPEPAPEPRMAALEPGTTIRATVDQELSTQTNQVGDTFTATVASAVTRDGEVVVPSGAKLEGEVTAVQKSGKPGEAAVLKLNFSRVSFRGQTYPVSLAITEANPQAKSRTSTGEAAGRIGIGAAAGAVLGRVIGGDAKGTLIGAAVGAAAGTAVVLTTGDADAVLPAGSPMTLRLEETLVVRLPEA